MLYDLHNNTKKKQNMYVLFNDIIQSTTDRREKLTRHLVFYMLSKNMKHSSPTNSEYVCGSLDSLLHHKILCCVALTI